jgi:hypothetical protein
MSFEDGRFPRGWILSALEMPVSEAVNPNAKACADRLRELLWSWGVSPDPRVRDMDALADLAARLYPEASEEGLLLAATLLLWFLVLDDVFDLPLNPTEELQWVQALQERSLALLEGGPLPAEAMLLDRVAAYIGARLTKEAAPAWRRAFLESLRVFMGATASAMEQRHGTRALDLEGYVAWRAANSGAELSIALHEHLAGIMLSDPLARSDDLTRLRTCCIRSLFIVNDILSYGVEVLDRNAPDNFVRLTAEARGLSMEDAVRECVAEANRTVRSFLALARKVRAQAGTEEAALIRHIEGMQALMRGNMDWTLMAERYRSPRSPFSEQRPEE